MTHREKKLPTRGRLWCEFVALYLLMPLLTLSLRLLGGAFPILPLLWLAAMPALIWLTRHGWTKASLLGWRGWREHWQAIVLRALVAALLLITLQWLLEPKNLFSMARHNPLLLLLICCFYPLASVYPQGVIYRALYYDRYALLLPTPLAIRLTGAFIFSFCHIFFLNGWALLFTLIGGWFFTGTYKRSRSLQLSNFEHALYGLLLFSIGFGRYLYHGTIVLLER